MRNLLYLVIMLVAVGCSESRGHISRSLDEASALMQTDPSAAMEKLNKFDVAEFEDSATMARWALLYSEALVANRIKAPTDTIVDIAIDYYGAHSLKAELNHASRLKSLLRKNGDTDSLSEALYLQKEKEFMLYKERMRGERIVLVSAMILLLAAGIIFWQRQRIKLKEIQNRELVSEASALMDGLRQNQTVCSDLQGKLRAVLSNRFDVIDQLCGTYFESQGTRIERKAIAEKVKSQIEELKSDTGLFAEMERCVNDCRGGLLDRLRHEWPEITNEDYRLMAYLACNLSNRSIAVLAGESIDVVYKRKSRLKAKITKLDTPGASQFRSVFSL